MGPTTKPQPPFRRVKLYTFQLTPRFELTEEAWAVVGPILFEGRDYPQPSEAYPWFFSGDNEDRRALVKYCEDLDCLHEDLDFALFDLETAQESSYSDSLLDVDDSMYFRRLALIYHAENVDLRVYAYREKVFKLVQHFFGMKGISDRDLRFKDRVRAELTRRGLDAIASRLDTLGRDIKLRAALERRNLFTHGLKERDEFSALTSAARIDEDVTGLGTAAKAQLYMDLDAAYRQPCSEIDEVCLSLAWFRFDLVQQLVSIDCSRLRIEPR